MGEVLVHCWDRGCDAGVLITDTAGTSKAPGSMWRTQGRCCCSPLLHNRYSTCARCCTTDTVRVHVVAQQIQYVCTLLHSRYSTCATLVVTGQSTASLRLQEAIVTWPTTAVPGHWQDLRRVSLESFVCQTTYR